MSNRIKPAAHAWAMAGQILRATEKEARHLKLTADRLRALAPDMAWVESLERDPEKGEMLDAFVARFARLQDTLGDKLLPAALRAAQESTGTQLDNLLRGEKLGWIDSTETWIELRALRNKLIHEYVDTPEDLLQAVIGALAGVAVLTAAQEQLAGYIKRFATEVLP